MRPASLRQVSPSSGFRMNLLFTMSRRTGRIRSIPASDQPNWFFFQTSCLLARGWPMPPRVPAINRSAPFQGFGGARRDRTDDLMLAKHALSQLSYSPVSRISRRLVGLERFELSTSRLSSARSNQLSYRPQPDVFTARCRLTPHRVFPHTGEPASFCDKSQQSRTRELVREERETKTAASRAW